jgi:ABC-2 type transport system permease protein
MRGLLSAELLKLRTTRRTFGLTAAMLALVCLIVLIHAFALPAENADHKGQMHVFSWGQLAALFAAFLGAMSFTAELQSGTIRPTFLATPLRSRVLAAKLVTSMLAGAAYGLAAVALTIGLGSAALSARGLPVRLDSGDYTQLFLGGVAAAALWAPLGLGLGALVRNQVAALVGLCAWLLFVENLLLQQIPDVVRYFPGAAAGALSGSTITGEVPTNPALLSPLIGALLLIAYAATATIAGMLATERRDVA